MSGFTAEYFAQATLATKGDYGVARRADPTETDPWHIYGDGQGWFSDEEMAADGWTPVVESGRLSLARLEAAWEAAEVPTDDAPFREGDVVIMKHSEGFNTFRVGGGPHEYLFDSGIRILSRAPREPWADLADLLRARLDDGVVRVEVDWAARELHAAGVRVTGGDDDE